MSETTENTELQSLIDRDEMEADTRKDEEIEEKPRRYLDKVKGFCGVMGSSLSAVVSYAAVQLLQRAVPDFELNTLRFSLACCFFTASSTF